jgi:prevent-host-death family protein
MAKKVSAAEAKANLSALMAEVAHGGKRVLIERRGKPIAALVSVPELERLEGERAKAERPRGALALVGGWRDVGDEQIDALVAGVYSRRLEDTGRPVELEG